MRTILHSSPEELVSSRSLGNLGRQVGSGQVTPVPSLPHYELPGQVSLVTSESAALPPPSLGLT